MSGECLTADAMSPSSRLASRTSVAASTLCLDIHASSRTDTGIQYSKFFFVLAMGDFICPDIDVSSPRKLYDTMPSRLSR